MCNRKEESHEKNDFRDDNNTTGSRFLYADSGKT